MNQIQLIGNLGADAQLSRTHAGKAVVNVRLATTEKWKGPNGERQEHTEWWQITMFGPAAEAVAPYIRKGERFFCQGRGQMREYTNKDGLVCKVFEVIAEKWELLGGGHGRGAQPARYEPEPKTVFDPPDSDPNNGAEIDDIPF